MDSINAKQPEENRKDLRSADAVAKIQDLVGKAQTGFFSTAGVHKTRPMNVRKVDDDGNLWFLAASDSHLIQILGDHPKVELYFQGSPHSDFLHLEGLATVSADKAKIKELWEPILKTWFTEGPDDPRITVIKVTPTSGYYWDTKHGGMVAGVKMLVGAAIGVTLDDSIEGTIDV